MLQLKVCPPSMKPHIDVVLNGEYDVPITFGGNPVILDIGANIGSFSVWAEDRWKGMIYAYEPNKENYDMLVINANGSPNIHCIHAAVRKDIIENKLYDGAYNCGECSFHQLGNQKETFTIVPVIPVSDLPACDILKIDTEGCEVEILSEMAVLGKLDTVKIILLEFHSELDRRKIDKILSNYVLCGGYCARPDMGTFKYVSTDIYEMSKRLNSS